MWFESVLVIMRIIHWNPFSLTVDRRLDIAAVFQNADIVVLVGTQCKRFDSDVYTSQAGLFHCYDWGYGTGSMTNKSAGLSIWLNKRSFSKHSVKYIGFPPDMLAGRGAVLRVKTSKSDICIIAGYPPPFAGTAKQFPKHRSIVQTLYKWIQKVVDELPARSTPFICLDANGKVGGSTESGMFSTTTSSAIGIVDPSEEDFNGRALKEILEFEHMTAINTFFPAGATYYGRCNNSRIDYVCCPSMLLQHVWACYTWLTAARKLQLFGGYKLRDHIPLVVEVEYELRYEGDSQAFACWDQDQLMRGVSRGFAKYAFLDEVEEWAMQDDPQWHSMLAEDNPDSSYEYLVNHIRSFATKHYAKVNKPATYKPYEAARMAALQSRRTARISWDKIRVASTPTRYDVFSAWRVQSKLDSTTRACKKYKQQQQQAIDEQRAADLAYAVQQQDTASEWKISRLMAGNSSGPKKRKYNVPKCQQPDGADWASYLAQSGPQGGFEAVIHDSPTPLPQTAPIWTVEHAWQAQEDLDYLRPAIKYAKTRRSHPTWAVPNELWRMMLYPNEHKVAKVAGIGFQPEGKRYMTKFYEKFKAFLAQIRRCNRTPVSWNHSHGHALDKGNGKTAFGGAAGQRLLHLLDPLGKAWHWGRWTANRKQRFPIWAQGFESGRRRENAIVTHMVTGFRSMKAQLSTVFVSYDMANFFPSVSHEALDAEVCQHVATMDVNIFMQRHRETYCTIPAADGPITVHNMCGGLQGDRHSPQLCTGALHKAIAEWQFSNWRQEYGKVFMTRCPFTSRISDSSFQSFADDIGKRYVAVDTQSIADTITQADQRLDTELRKIGVAQNGDKKTILPTIVDRGAQKINYQIFAGHLQCHGKVHRDVRYLGPYFQHRFSNTTELNKRIQAIRAGFYSMGRFWWKCRNMGSIRVVFLAKVLSAAYSGLTAFVLTAAEMQKLDRVLMGLMRSVSKGTACQKQYDEEHDALTYQSRTNAWVRHKFQIATTDVELCVARLKWMQTMVRSPEDFICVTAAVFGTYVWDKNGPLTEHGYIHENANPWAKQMWQDLQCLREHDVGDVLLQMLDGRIGRLWQDPECADMFQRIDATFLRAKYLTQQIPPPGTEIPADDEAAPESEIVPEHVCLIPSEEGIPCNLVFIDKRRLLMHQRMAHGVRHLVWNCVPTNQCPFCLNVFASRFTAIVHVERMLARGYCTGEGSCLCMVPNEPASYTCGHCNTELLNLSSLHWHVRSHFPVQELFVEQPPKWQPALGQPHGASQLARDGRTLEECTADAQRQVGGSQRQTSLASSQRGEALPRPAPRAPPRGAALPRPAPRAHSPRPRGEAPPRPRGEALPRPAPRGAAPPQPPQRREALPRPAQRARPRGEALPRPAPRGAAPPQPPQRGEALPRPAPRALSPQPRGEASPRPGGEALPRPQPRGEALQQPQHPPSADQAFAGPLARECERAGPAARELQQTSEAMSGHDNFEPMSHEARRRLITLQTLEQQRPDYSRFRRVNSRP